MNDDAEFARPESRPKTATWNTPQAIAEHRAMSPEERVRKTIALSQAALRFGAAPGVKPARARPPQQEVEMVPDTAGPSMISAAKGGRPYDRCSEDDHPRRP